MDSIVPWKDAKKPLWAIGLLVPLLPVLGAVLSLYSGSDWGMWLAPLVVYLIIPAMDFLIGEDRSNPPESAVPNLEAQRFYRWVVWAYIPLQYAGTAWVTYLVSQGQFSPIGLIGAVLSCAYVNGIAINTAHELGHKRSALEHWLAKITLAPVAYGHFFVEHNYGHHRRVATPEDPASSRMGESFWVFLPRTVIGSLRSACDIERQRLARKGRGFWSLHNELLQAWSMSVVLFIAVALAWGPYALLFLVVQAVLGASLLEVINYVEHYGLLRQRRASGGYERCQPEHSWNSNHTVTNLLLYQLQRHSDHHANPKRCYQALRHFDNSPQLPSGYASMIVMAYITPLWFRIMDPKVVAHYEGDLSRANIQPGKAAMLERRYCS